MRASISLDRPEKCAKQSNSWERRHPCLLVSSKAPLASESSLCKTKLGVANQAERNAWAPRSVLGGQIPRATRAISFKSLRPSSPLKTSTIA